ncbi:MAG: Rossmann-like and DUF2520 domain-containing protein [Bacteroidota bacterium]
MNLYEKITIVGAGNVAWHLASALEEAGCSVVQVYSRQVNKAQELAARLKQAQPTAELDFSDSPATLFVLTVSDDAIAAVAQQMKLPEQATVVHTSGGQPMQVLNEAATDQIGVFYPLQTFSKQRTISFQNIPLCLEAIRSEVLDGLTQLAQKLSKQVVTVNSRQRAALHVAAVFANNFTNHLLRMSEQLLQESQLDIKLLHPLIEETVTKAQAMGVAHSQTGPARRNDQKTIDHHLDYLRSFDPAYTKVYRVLTKSIQSIANDI